ncbi:MAG: hypothetical protein K0U98_24605 [Deltaproteobacteria bacterium]|nr:hypothetical protein [Deltaproteobacteria bacterium]
MRKFLFPVVLALLVFLATEILSFLGLSALEKGWVSYRSLSEARQEILSDDFESSSPDKQALRQTRRFQQHFGINVLHPFMGFVSLPRDVVRKRANFRPGAANLGFPDNHFSLVQKESDDKVVVGLFGGSVANILANVAFDQLSEEIAAIPRFAGKKVILNHAALGGFKQPQQLMALNYFVALGGHFDVVINLDGFNEVALPGPDLVAKGIFPHYPRDWYFRTAGMDSELRLSLGRIEVLRDQRRQNAQFFSGPWLRRSFTGALLWTLRDQRLDGELASAQLELMDRDGGSKSFQTRGPRRNYPEPEDLYQDLAAMWIRSSQQMHSIAKGLGAEYYHFLQPNQYLEGSKVLTQEELQRAFQEDHRYRVGVVEGYPLLQSAGQKARAEGLPFIDLTAVFRDVPQTLYTDSCCHFNLEGNFLLARAMVDAIAAGPAS